MLFDKLENSELFKMTISALRIDTTKLKTQKKVEDIECLPEITLKEVSNHDMPSDCWIIIYDRVYDVSDFLNKHPGGREVLLEHAGRDASLAFADSGHSKETVLSLRNYEIGQLPKHERIYRCKGLLRTLVEMP